jgi:hypothetical protein
MNWYRETPAYIPLFNETARAAMRAKYLWDRLLVSAYCRGKREGIDRWFNGLRLFFGFSSIRGGTVFLTNLLKLEVPNSHIEHEANLDDYWNLPLVIQDESEGFRYLDTFRKNEIYYRSDKNIGIYGEVNPMIRMHCAAFKSVFPTAKLFHMVRDPRNVIRSIMGKENLGKKDPMAMMIYPPPSDPYAHQWPEMSRFERVCWEWQFNNRYMRQHISHTTHFESMMSDYDYFKEKLVDFLEIDISQVTWDHYVNKPRNASRTYRFPHWREWDKDKLKTLDRICGDEMSRYGYSV